MYRKTYSPGEVIKALDVYNTVNSYRKASQITRIGKSTIQRWWVGVRKIIQRKTKRKKQCKRRHKFPELDNMIENLFQHEHVMFWDIKHVQTTLKRLHDIAPSLSLLHRALKRCKISRRRFDGHSINPKTPSEMRPLLLAFRNSLHRFSNEEIVCLDETSFCNTGNLCYGYFPKGRQPKMINVPK